MVARRGFHSTRAQLGSPYHYPEGPRSNIPFNPLTKWFAVRYWTFMAVGFGKFGRSLLWWQRLTDMVVGAPFGIAVWQTKKNQ
jgi:cytochrome c oxidase subunit 7c